MEPLSYFFSFFGINNVCFSFMHNGLSEAGEKLDLLFLIVIMKNKIIYEIGSCSVLPYLY